MSLNIPSKSRRRYRNTSKPIQAASGPRSHLIPSHKPRTHHRKTVLRRAFEHGQKISQEPATSLAISIKVKDTHISIQIGPVVIWIILYALNLPSPLTYVGRVFRLW